MKKEKWEMSLHKEHKTFQRTEVRVTSSFWSHIILQVTTTPSGKWGHSTWMGKGAKTPRTVAAARIWNSLPGGVRKSTSFLGKGTAKHWGGINEKLYLLTRNILWRPLFLNVYPAEQIWEETAFPGRWKFTNHVLLSIGKQLALRIEGSHTTRVSKMAHEEGNIYWCFSLPPVIHSFKLFVFHQTFVPT